MGNTKMHDLLNARADYSSIATVIGTSSKPTPKLTKHTAASRSAVVTQKAHTKLKRVQSLFAHKKGKERHRRGTSSLKEPSGKSFKRRRFRGKDALKFCERLNFAAV